MENKITRFSSFKMSELMGEGQYIHEN